MFTPMLHHVHTYLFTTHHSSLLLYPIYLLHITHHYYSTLSIYYTSLIIITLPYLFTTHHDSTPLLHSFTLLHIMTPLLYSSPLLYFTSCLTHYLYFTLLTLLYFPC